MPAAAAVLPKDPKVKESAQPVMATACTQSAPHLHPRSPPPTPAAACHTPPRAWVMCLPSFATCSPFHTRTTHITHTPVPRLSATLTLPGLGHVFAIVCYLTWLVRITHSRRPDRCGTDLESEQRSWVGGGVGLGWYVCASHTVGGPTGATDRESIACTWVVSCCLDGEGMGE
jgi:hypothetical protein